MNSFVTSLKILARTAMKSKLIFTCFSLVGIIAVIISACNQNSNSAANKPVVAVDSIWHAPDTSSISGNPDATLIRYGQKLISNTSYYLGPKGTVAQITNGMNCQNCHLQAGTKPFGNNYASVASTYPKFRARSGSIESIYKRVNDCIQRSLNGKAIDSNSKEMQAITAYIKWVGKDVPKKKVPYGSGIKELAYLDRAADTIKGRFVYEQKCLVCHEKNGDGMKDPARTGYLYPPLWGEHSYTAGAGMMRISRLAGYAKFNMPYGTNYPNSQLTDEEAWDVASYINSQPRPTHDISSDWPDISLKPVDHPFGPFIDNFPEAQHKYGPFKPIAEAKKRLKKA